MAGLAFVPGQSVYAAQRQTEFRPTEARSQKSKETIRDRYGRVLGEIRPIGSGRLEARDRLGRLLGRYDPKTNETRDPLSRLLTKGNTLSALVVKAAEPKRK